MNDKATLRPIGETFEIVYPPVPVATDFEVSTYPLVITYEVVAHVDIWPDGKAEEVRAIGQRVSALEGKREAT